MVAILLIKYQWYWLLTFNYPKGWTVYKYGLGVSTACFPGSQADSWLKLLPHYGLSDLPSYSPLSGHEKTWETRND